MKQITLQFVTVDSAIDATIRWYTDSPISHVDTITPGGKLLGSQLHKPCGDGVLVRAPNYAKFSCVKTLTFDVTDEQFGLYWVFLVKQLGKPYDSGAVIGLFLHRDWRSDKKWFCSELIAAALEYAGILQIDTKVNWVSPQMLYLLVSTKFGA